MDRLNRKRSAYQDRPVKVIQFGEGNFLRAFADYMIDCANEQNIFNGNIVLIKPMPQNTASDISNLFQKQECQYTVVLRGQIDGQISNTKRIISCVKEMIRVHDAYAEFLALAGLDTLELVISNTTEAGITYDAADCRTEDEPPRTYPGKLTAFLYERFRIFAGDPEKALYILPTELIDDNAAKLKQCILHYASDWKLGAQFSKWVTESCTFCNTLVDRIVSGYPREEAEQMQQEMGYEDALLDVAEPFGLWVIEEQKEIRKIFPLDRAGMPILFAESIAPYKKRKVRILNGAHTSFALASFLAGNDDVYTSMQDACVRNYIRKTLYREVIPELALPEGGTEEFAAAVLERFSNPFIRHRLLSIALNSVSKWRERCMPSLIAYEQNRKQLPSHLVFSLAALLQFYSGTEYENGVFTGSREADENVSGAEQKYQICDDRAVLEFFSRNGKYTTAEFTEAALGQTAFWGINLNQISGLTRAVTVYLGDIRYNGMRKAMERLDQNE